MPTLPIGIWQIEARRNRFKRPLRKKHGKKRTVMPSAVNAPTARDVLRAYRLLRASIPFDQTF
jgi:hypothetical protein